MKDKITILEARVRALEVMISTLGGWALEKDPKLLEFLELQERAWKQDANKITDPLRKRHLLLVCDRILDAKQDRVLFQHD